MASLNPVQGALGHRRAAHLLRRTSFRFTRLRVDELAGMTVTEALASLLTAAPLQLDQPVYSAGVGTPAPWINPPQPPNTPLPADDDDLKPFVLGWWLHEALHDPGISHRMTLFLHQFLAVDANSGSSMAFFDYLMLLRWGSLGNFKQLVVKMALNNCMLAYLDNDQNFVNNPNENFARELFELFTIGKGLPAGPGDYTTFTETDVIEAARVLTGFNREFRHLYADPDTGLPAGRGFPQSHDFAPKTFSARFGGQTITPPSNDEAGMNAEWQALVDLIFAQDETARNICRRLYRYFVRRNIDQEVENDIIGGLLQTFKSNNFALLPVLEQLLASTHFFDEDDADPADEVIGALIKSPLDLSLQAFSFFNLPIPDPITDNENHYLTLYNGGIIERMLGQAGMTLFYPYDVAGYSGYYQDPDYNRQFFNSATIVSRYKLPEQLLSGTYAWGPGGSEPLGTQLDIAVWVRDESGIADPADPYVLVQELVRYLFPELPDSERFDYFYIEIFLNNLPPADWTYEWQNYLATGDDSEVNIALGRLFNALLYAPEYQVM